MMESRPRDKRTFLFTWNPRKWQWDDLPQAVYEANVDGCHFGGWSCITTRNISPGDRAFLMRLGVPPKGIIGCGVVVSEPFESLHWNRERAKQRDKGHYVEIRFDILSELPILPEETLTSGALGEYNWFPRASGLHIPDDVADRLEK